MALGSAGSLCEFIEGVCRGAGAVSEAGEGLPVSSISVLEIARLVADGQYDLGISVDLFVEEALANDGFLLLDLSTSILIESTRLPGDIHRDPSDRLLVATAREYGLTLITRDKSLLRYAKAGHMSARKP